MQISSNPLAGEFEGYDTTSIEVGFIKDTLRPAFSGLGMPRSPENRREIRELVSTMVIQFGL